MQEKLEKSLLLHNFIFFNCTTNQTKIFCFLKHWLNLNEWIVTNRTLMGTFLFISDSVYMPQIKPRLSRDLSDIFNESEWILKWIHRSPRKWWKLCSHNWRIGLNRLFSMRSEHYSFNKTNISLIFLVVPNLLWPFC